jgi:hypothetical protein
MNQALYNELIEAKGNGTLGTVLREKFASLNIETEEEIQYLFDCTNEKTASIDDVNKAMGGGGSPGSLKHGARKAGEAFTNRAATSNNGGRGSPLAKIITGLSLAGIAAIPIGKMIHNATKKKSVYDQVLAANPDLKTHPKTKDHYDMLWHVAPNLAANHIIAGSVLEQLKAYDMIDHQMIAKLVEADKNMAESRSKAGPITTAGNLSQIGKNLSDINQNMNK